MRAEGRNIEWAKSKLYEYAAALNKLTEAGRDLRAAANKTAVRARYDYDLADASKLAAVAYEILNDVVPGADFSRDLGLPEARHVQIQLVHRAIGTLESSRQLEENWSSDFTIEINTSQMHPWVWDTAKAIWEVGRYSEALQAAAVAVNARMQEKLGSDDKEFHSLARSAFKFEDPTSSDPRLRFKERKDWNRRRTTSSVSEKNNPIHGPPIGSMTTGISAVHQHIRLGPALRNVTH